MAVASEAEPGITWTVHPMESQPRKGYIVLAAAIIAAALGLIFFRNPIMAGLGFAMIAGPTAEFWLGAKFTVDEKGVSSRVGLSVSSIEWPDVKRVTIQGDTVKVSPLESGSRLEEFRGVSLKFGNQDREAILAAMRKWGGENVRFIG
ncbi:MAG: hypothetical protein JSS72_08440 [Armatimonadetes bacterium]|nr:hypothetical protein [Armatimonadota bacterium]